MLELVIEISECSHAADLPPWEIAPCVAYSFLPLNGNVPSPAVGLVVAELVLFNDVDVRGLPMDVLGRFLKLDEGDIGLPGGVRITADDGRVIVPGEYCGLEDWRDWMGYEADEFTVWMGRDPSPWVERAGDTLRVWSDGSVNQADPADLFHIDIPLSTDARRNPAAQPGFAGLPRPAGAMGHAV